jgi:hypothetical protein
MCMAMNTINRTLLILIPKKPFLDWVESFDIETDAGEYSAYLIPEKYDEYNYMDYLEKHWQYIFDSELYGILKDPNFYPEKRDYKTFNMWFGTHVCDTVFDLGNDLIEIEEF